MEQPVLKSEITGDGDPLVLVPGGLTGWLSWQPFVPLLDKDRKVIRLQLLNVDYGLQNKPLPQNYSLSFESQALDNTLEQLNITEADFVAWSYGAAITMDFALNHPERVRSLTLIEPPAIWVLRNKGILTKELDEDQKQMQTFVSDNITEDQLAWFTHFAGFVPTSVDPKTVPQWQVWLKHRQSLRENIVVFNHTDSLKRLQDFHKPVLLVTGEGTSLFLAEIIKALSEEFPNARIANFPGGHAPHIVAQNDFLLRLRDFLTFSK